MSTPACKRLRTNTPEWPKGPVMGSKDLFGMVSSFLTPQECALIIFKVCKAYHHHREEIARRLFDHHTLNAEGAKLDPLMSLSRVAMPNAPCTTRAAVIDCMPKLRCLTTDNLDLLDASSSAKLTTLHVTSVLEGMGGVCNITIPRIADRCPNLTELSISVQQNLGWAKFLRDADTQGLPRLTQLQKISFISCSLLYTATAQLLSQMPSLTAVDFSNCRDFDGRAVGILLTSKSIRVLGLRDGTGGVDHDQDSNLEIIAKQGESLTHLDLRNGLYEGDRLAEVAACCNNLVFMDLTGYSCSHLGTTPEGLQDALHKRNRKLKVIGLV